MIINYKKKNKKISWIVDLVITVYHRESQKRDEYLDVA